MVFVKPVDKVEELIARITAASNEIRDAPNMLVVVDLGFTTPLTSQVISVAFYSEREKSDKFCSEALISA